MIFTWSRSIEPYCSWLILSRVWIIYRGRRRRCSTYPGVIGKLVHIFLKRNGSNSNRQTHSKSESYALKYYVYFANSAAVKHCVYFANSAAVKHCVYFANSANVKHCVNFSNSSAVKHCVYFSNLAAVKHCVYFF